MRGGEESGQRRFALRRRRCTICNMFVTLLTSHALMSPLKLAALSNMASMLVTLLTSHALMSPLKLAAS